MKASLLIGAGTVLLFGLVVAPVVHHGGRGLGMLAIFVAGAGTAALAWFIWWMWRNAQPRRAVRPAERLPAVAVRSSAAVAAVPRAAITGRRIVAGELIASEQETAAGWKP